MCKWSSRIVSARCVRSDCLTRPEPIEAIAEVPDGPPVRFNWRRVMHDVAHAEGPERIAMEWWRDDQGRTLTRDYFRIESRDGARVWLYREGLYGARRNGGAALVPARSFCVKAMSCMVAYAELAVTTNFSFLRGASHPEELVKQAANSDLPASALPIATRSRASCAPTWRRRKQVLSSPSVRGSSLPTARPTFSPIRRIGRPGAG